eukprot:5933151-Lingulodinium_polyedra.AAC.1
MGVGSSGSSGCAACTGAATPESASPSSPRILTRARGSGQWCTKLACSRALNADRGPSSRPAWAEIGRVKVSAAIKLV